MNTFVVGLDNLLSNPYEDCYLFQWPIYSSDQKFLPRSHPLILSRSGFYNAAAYSCIGGGCWATIYRDTLYRLWRDTLFPQAEDKRSIEECRDNTT